MSSTKLKNIKEVIVVEGKSDTSHLKRLFNCDTIETNGSALNDKTINLIIAAAKNKGVILFLDPDHAGEIIRKKIIEKLKNLTYKQAFITQKVWNTYKKGVSEANDKNIIEAIENATEFVPKYVPSLLWDEYDELDLHSFAKRQKLCNYLKISYANHKQLFKRLNMMGFNLENIKN